MDTKIIGHEIQMAYLRRQCSDTMFHHAYLFIGPQYCGGKTVMHNFASLLHPVEIIEICAQNDELKRPIISIKRIRQVRDQLSRTARKEGIRVVCIPNSEHLTSESGNALLKILEEPQANIVFLLRAPTRNAILSTILSRCFVVHLSQVTLTAQAIAQKLNFDDYNSIDESIRLSLGRVGRALTYSLDIHARDEARKRAQDRSIFMMAPFADRLIQSESFTDEMVDEWLLGIEIALLERREFSLKTIVLYASLIMMQQEKSQSLRQQSISDAFCLRVNSVY